jgi:hypothetical protein
MTTLITLAWLAAIGLDHHFRGWAKIEGSKTGFVPDYVLDRIPEARDLAEALVAEGKWIRREDGFRIVGFDPDPMVVEKAPVAASQPVDEVDEEPETEEVLAPEKSVQVFPEIENDAAVLSVREQIEARIEADRLAATVFTEEENSEEEFDRRQREAAERLSSTVVVEDEEFDISEEEDEKEAGFQTFRRSYPTAKKPSDSDELFHLYRRRTNRCTGGSFELMNALVAEYAARVEDGDADLVDASTWLSERLFKDEDSFRRFQYKKLQGSRN